ncbi:MAG: (S)-benzoin forming benzil reductase [Bacteroidia bacterium]|nr:(S)-benzoin forming benzil reductase [Bacteroidia bacterium]
METYLITGTSRGLGEALAYQLLDPKHRLICISRGENQKLVAAAAQRGCELHYHQLDLVDVAASEAWMEAQLKQLTETTCSRLVVVHNAGLLHPIKLVGKGSSAQEVTDSMQANLLSPMRMTEAMVRHTQRWAIPKQVLMISSGAGRKPMASWSTYCTTKAGLDMFARCVALEQAVQDHPVKVVSLAPGVVDTFMQGYIRKQSHETFPNVQRFLSLHADGLLSTPEFAAQQLISWLNKPDFGQEVIADVRG